MSDTESLVLKEVVKEVAVVAKRELLEDDSFKKKLVQVIKKEFISILTEDFVRDEMYEAMLDQGIIYDLTKVLGQELKKVMTKHFKETK